jgi:hypothetical protein
MADALADDRGQFADLDEIEQQSSRRANVGTRQRGVVIQQNRGSAWVLSPAIERAKPAREKPSPPVKPAIAKPAPEMKIVAPSVEIGGRVLAQLRGYDEMWSAIRRRAGEFGTREELDSSAGCASGYMGKLLGAAQVKRFGKHSLGWTLGATGTYLLLVEDSEQTTKLKAVVDALRALAAVAELGISQAEFKRIARLAVSPVKANIGLIGDALERVGCHLVLVEDEAQTVRMTARAAACRSTRRSPVKTINRNSKQRGDHA